MCCSILSAAAPCSISSRLTPGAKAFVFHFFRTDFPNEGRARIARWAIARTLRALGEVDEALAMQTALLEENRARSEEDGYVYEELGECLLLLGAEVEARPYFAEAYRLLSRDSWLSTNEPNRLARLKALSARS